MTHSINLGVLREALCLDGWFRECSAATQDALLTHGRERRLLPGEHLFQRGEPDDGLYCLTAGALTVQSVDAQGGMPVLVVLEPYHWFGELSFTDGKPRSHDAVADLPSTVWCVPRLAMQAWLSTHPQGWHDVARLAVGKLRVVYHVVDEELRRPIAQRVARRLWLALQGWGWRPDAPRQRVNWSQEQLARMLGAGRGSVNLALRELEQAGAIRLHYGAIEMLDAVRLRRACELQPVASSPLVE
jgi:CRP/FNR family transcriptional regulator, cyclic AMP receptor protein